MQEQTILAVSPEGRKLGHISLNGARRRIRAGTALAKRTKHKLRAVVLLCDRDLSYGVIGGYYNEDLGGGKHVGTMKRVVNGELRKWDQNLTFAELRAGRIISEKTVNERAQAFPHAA